MEAADDAELMRRMRLGDRQAFGELVEKYKHQMVAYLGRLTGNRAQAEDLAQDAFIKLFLAAPKYDERGKCSGFLYRIATNLALSEKRKQTRRRWLRVAFLSSNGHGEHLSNPQIDAEQNEMRNRVQQALNQLPLRLRAPLVMFELEGAGYTDIALSMGVREGTVKSRIFRARQQLKDILTKAEDGGKS